MKKIAWTFLCFSCQALTVAAGNWFTQNNGQLKNSDGKPATDILFYADLSAKRYFFTRDRVFSAEMAWREGKRFLIREEFDLRTGNDNLFLSAEHKQPFYFNFFLPNAPDGITGVGSFSVLNYSDGFGNLVYSLCFENGNLRISDGFLSSSLRPENTGTAMALPWSTFLGGTDTDETWGIDHDSQNNVIVCGHSMSLDFPVTPNCMQDTTRGLYDAFISKFDVDGNLLWSTYYGSTGNDFAYKAVTGSDNTLYITGYTSGTDLPVSTGCFQNSNAGSYDAFLLKLTPGGSRVWATYFGGSGGDLGLAIARDANQNIFIGGSTTSLVFPVTVGAYQSVNNGPMECYVAKFDSSGARTWCTFYGGTGSEDVHALTADPSGNVIVIGGSFSADFPVSNGCFQNFNAGVKDLFVLKFDGTGNRIFGTYCGGTAFEDGLGVTTDAGGNIFISGTTSSADFPVTPGCYQPGNAGGDDMFVMKFNPDGTQGWSTYFGGAGTENNYGMDTPGNDMYYMVLSTNSANIPVIGPGPFNSLQGITDAFIVKFNRYGQPSWSTYFGGSLQDVPHCISADPQMRVAITGLTSSADYPVTFGAFQIINNGNDDAFVTELDGSFDNTVGIVSFSHEQQALIYPNPVLGSEFLVSYNGSIEQTELFDACGKRVSFSPEITSMKENLSRFALKDLPADGVYLLKLVSGDHTVCVKLIIAH